MAAPGMREDGALGAQSAAARALLRAERVFRTYPADNPVSRKALDELIERVVPCLPLEVEVRADGLARGGTLLVESAQERSDLPERLFGDGVRRIRFESGLERAELERMLVAVSAPLAPDDLTEDYVTRLWEAELPHLHVFAVDPYLDFDVPGEVLEGKQRPTAEVESLEAPLTTPLPPPPDEAFRLTEADRSFLAQEVEAARAGAPWESFIEALFDLLEDPDFAERASDVVELLETSFQRVLEDGRLALAADIAERLATVSDHEANAHARRALERMMQPERLAPLRVRVEDRSCPPDVAARLLGAFGARAAASSAQQLLACATEHGRRVYAEILVGFGRSGFEAAAAALARAQGPSRVALIRCLGSIGDPRAVRLLLEELNRQEASLRREAVRALARFRDRTALSRLLDVALSDSDPACRVIALRGLGKAQTQLPASGVVARLRSKHFFELEEEERGLLFAALAAVGGEDALGFLEACLRPRWFLSQRQRELGQRAIEALARLGTGRARTILERAARRGRGELAASCERALARFGGERR